MPNATNYLDAGFGVELECYLPEGATGHAAAAAVAHRLGAPCVFEGYNHHLRPHWKVVTDGSLGDVTRGIEFVSPILRGTAGLDQLVKVCRALTDFGCTVSKKCGLHVHVGVGAPGIDFFKNLVRLYSTFEPVIDSMMPASRRASTNMFCRSMTAAAPAAVAAAPTFESLVRVATASHGGEGRYFKLNLVAYRRHRTVEFRQHSGTLDAEKARMWTVLCLRMVAAAHRGNLNLGSTGPSLNRARPGSKSHRIGEMLLRSEGVTGGEVCAAMNWPSVSMPQQARVCGIEFTTQRTGREVRYFARSAAAVVSTTPITVEGFARTIEATDDERAYMVQRVSNLAGPIAWAA